MLSTRVARPPVRVCRRTGRLRVGSSRAIGAGAAGCRRSRPGARAGVGPFKGGIIVRRESFAIGWGDKAVRPAAVEKGCPLSPAAGLLSTAACALENERNARVESMEQPCLVRPQGVQPAVVE